MVLGADGVRFLDLLRKEVPIGVDISSEALVVAEMKREKGAFHLARLGVAPTPPNAVRDGEIVDPMAVANALQELMIVEGFQAKKAITAVSGQAAIIRTVRFPSMPAKELDEVVRSEAERYIPFSLDEVNLDYQVLEEVMEDDVAKVEVLLVAAQKQLIDTYTEALALAGLQPMVVDVASFAVSRALKDVMATPELVVLVLIHGETTDINVMRNGVPRFSRSIPIGSASFVQQLASGLNLSLEEANALFGKLAIPVAGGPPIEDPEVEKAAGEVRGLIRELTSELQRSLEYYHQSQGTEKIQQVLLSGRGAQIRHLDKHLAMNLGMDVEIGNPVSVLTFDEGRYDADYLLQNAPVFATAIGLARRGLEVK